jgi:hypothetical protein
MCDRWRRDFSAFLSDMGPRPSLRHSIDRIDNDGPYSPDNCRWATPKQQATNARSVILVDGVSLSEFAARHGVNYLNLYKRVTRGTAPKVALEMMRTGRRKSRAA